MAKTVFVAMSGGVDSSLAALLLKEQGFKVTGVTLKLWEGQPQSTFSDARSVADQIGIEHHVIDACSIFSEKVIANFSHEYANGMTPNPCVICNELIKFGLLLDWSLVRGADFLGTGHYARTGYDSCKRRHLLLKGKDEMKDQSYALWRLRQSQLAHVIFPLGEYTKAEIRRLAAVHNLPVAHKAESQEICFIPDNDYRSFLNQGSPKQPPSGKIISTSGEELGSHTGIERFTVGQRKNLGIAVGYPLYVYHIDRENNAVVVGTRNEIFRDCLRVEDTNFIATDPPVEDMAVKARIRYNMREAGAILKRLEEDDYFVCFEEPQWAITPGQSAVFYRDTVVIGGGIIREAVDIEDISV